MAGPFATDFAADFGNGAFLASGRAAAHGRATPQFSVGTPATQVAARGAAKSSGRATVATIVVSVAARGAAAGTSLAGGASLFTLGLRGTAQAHGAVIGQVVAQVSARGSARSEGRAQKATAVSARGFARAAGVSAAVTFPGGTSPFAAAFAAAFGAGTALSVTVSARGAAAAHGRATKAFGLIAVRGFAVSHGRASPSVRTGSLAARGRASSWGTAHDTIQAQQVPVDGAPPPLTIWQRLCTVTPSHSLQEKPRVLRNTFGDGYGQTIPDGLTPIVRTLTLSWENLDKTEADQIVQFLKNSIGTPISFAAPRELAPRNWIAVDWRRTSPQPNADNLTVTFEDRPFVEMILGL